MVWKSLHVSYLECLKACPFSLHSNQELAELFLLRQNVVWTGDFAGSAQAVVPESGADSENVTL